MGIHAELNKKCYVLGIVSALEGANRPLGVGQITYQLSSPMGLDLKLARGPF